MAPAGNISLPFHGSALNLTISNAKLSGMAPIPAHVPLRVLRQLRGLTGKALAQLLADNYGVTVTAEAIFAVELGHNTAGLALRNAWAEELGVKPSDIHMGPELREIIAAAGAPETGKREDGAAA